MHPGSLSADSGNPGRDWLVDVPLVIFLTMTTLSLADAKAHLSQLIAVSAVSTNGCT